MSTNDLTATGCWVGVVFFQGEEADRVLDYINNHGTQATVEYLSNWDYGDETTNAAITNGEVYEEIPYGMLDHTANHGEYVLSYNPFMGHVGLYRQTNPEPIQYPEPGPQLTPESVSRRSAVRDVPWYEPTRRPDTASSARGLGL